MERNGFWDGFFMPLCAFVGFWTLMVGAYFLLREAAPPVWHFIEPGVGIALAVALFGAFVLIGLSLAAAPAYSAWTNRSERSRVANVFAAVGSLLSLLLGLYIVLIVVEVVLS